MFGRKFIPLEEGSILENPEADYKTAQRIGQFRVSSNAIYKPDYTYLPFQAVTDHVQDKTSVHVTGCCAGGVPVERIMMITEKGKYPFLFDTKKEAEKMIALLGK